MPAAVVAAAAVTVPGSGVVKGAQPPFRNLPDKA